MKLLKNYKELEFARLQQLIIHAIYLTLGALAFHAIQRPYYYYPLLMISNALFFICTMYIANFFLKEKESFQSLTPFIMAGTILLNMEGYGFFSYMAAGFFGVLSRVLLKSQNKHIFNPGLFGSFALVMLWPHSATFSLGIWQSDFKFIFLILLLGNFVVYKAGRLGVCYGYILGFTGISLLATFVLKASGIKYNGFEMMPALFWPSTLLISSSLIFIFHVISDPKTSPHSLKDQFIFGASIGVLDLLLRISLVIPAEAIAYLSIQVIYSFKGAYLNFRRKPMATGLQQFS